MTEKLRPILHRVARSASRSQWLARGVVVLASLLTVLAGALAGAEIRWWLVVLVGAGAVTTALQPDSHAGSVTLFVLVLFWWWTVPSSSGGWVLLAAAGVVAFHVAATLAAYGPPTVELATDLVKLWVGRGLVLWAVGLAAWAVGRLPVSGGPSAVLALVLVAGVTWWAAVRFGPVAVPGRR